MAEGTEDERGWMGGDGAGLGGGVTRGGSAGVAAVGGVGINGGLGDKIQGGRVRSMFTMLSRTMVTAFRVRLNGGAGQLCGRVRLAGCEGFRDQSLFFCTSVGGGDQRGGGETIMLR